MGSDGDPEGDGVRERPLRVVGAPTRCPYCHADVTPEAAEALLVCSGCLARHHGECWLGTCASCGADEALVPARVRPARAHGAERSPAFAWNQWTVNWGWLAVFLANFVTMPAGFIIDEVLGGGPSLGAAVALAPGFVGAALALLMWGLNSYDAVERSRAGEAGALAVVLAATTPCTGGLSGFAYYMFWGRRRGPERDAADPADGVGSAGRGVPKAPSPKEP